MKIVLADGTEILNGTVGHIRDRLELTMKPGDATANIAKFLNPEVMSKITFFSGAWKTEYDGFDRLSYIENPSNADEIRVWMEGNENSTVSDPIPLFDAMYMPKGASDQNG